MGTRVRTVIGQIEAIVIGVCIRGNNVEYNIRYFSDGEMKDPWLFDFEIETFTQKQEAGFGKIKLEEETPYTLLQ